MPAHKLGLSCCCVARPIAHWLNYHRGSLNLTFKGSEETWEATSTSDVCPVRHVAHGSWLPAGRHSLVYIWGLQHPDCTGVRTACGPAAYHSLDGSSKGVYVSVLKKFSEIHTA